MIKSPMLHKERLMALLFVLCLAGCTGSTPEAQHYSGATMGTEYQVTLYAPDSHRVKLEIGIQRVLSRVVGRMSTYEPGSDVSRFNAAAPGNWVEVAAETARVVERALSIAAQSDGRFDPTILPLVDAWGFGPRGRVEEQPSAATVERLLGQVGWAELTVRTRPPALHSTHERNLDLSGIAKGYAADAVAEYLKTQDVEHFLIELGGDLVARGGKPGGKPWRVAIENPDPWARSVYRVLEITEGALVTSGDYRNFYVEDNTRWTHVIDPQTGRPIDHQLASVSVRAKDAMSADAWATALLVAGPDAAAGLAVQNGIAALLIERTSANAYDETRVGSFGTLTGGDRE